MSDSVAGVVLAAGRGDRLRPLTRARPKALCPIAGVPLVDLAIDRVAPLTADIAVNVHHHRAALEGHLDGRVHVSVEAEQPLGTAGALGHLRDWVAGRPVLVVNADAWCPASAAPLVEGWDGERIRVLVAGGDRLERRSAIAGALLPWADVAALEAEPAGLYEASWGAAAAAGRVEVLRYDGPFVDCGTPAAYLAANLAANGGESVVDPGASVMGVVERSVVWSDGVVRPRERLVDAIRFDGVRTVLVRSR